MGRKAKVVEEKVKTKKGKKVPSFLDFLKNAEVEEETVFSILKTSPKEVNAAMSKLLKEFQSSGNTHKMAKSIGEKELRAIAAIWLALISKDVPEVYITSFVKVFSE